MNPIVLGAIIGAVPALIGSALTVWVTRRADTARLRQAELTIAAEHAQWLRDRRSDLYPEMIKFAKGLDDCRFHAAAGPKADMRTAVGRTLDALEFHVSLPDLMDRVAAFASDYTTATFHNVIDSDCRFWQAILLGQLEARDDSYDCLPDLSARAEDAVAALETAARYDLGLGGPGTLATCKDKLAGGV
jgi:hypothetical protein